MGIIVAQSSAEEVKPAGRFVRGVVRGATGFLIQGMGLQQTVASPHRLDHVYLSNGLIMGMSDDDSD
jgi:hypothetical protein